MITEITEDTTVKEICEVLDYMGSVGHANVYLDFGSWECTCKKHQRSKVTKDNVHEYVLQVLADSDKADLLFEKIEEVLK